VPARCDLPNYAFLLYRITPNLPKALHLSQDLLVVIDNDTAHGKVRAEVLFARQVRKTRHREIERRMDMKFAKRTIEQKHQDLIESLFTARMTRRVRTHLLGLIPESKEIWRKAIKEFKRDESALRLPYTLGKNTKTYALDGLAVARMIGIPDERISVPLQIFCLFYLSVHIIDDLVEDQTKFCAHFAATANKHGECHPKVIREVLPFSYTLNALLSMHRMLSEHSLFTSRHEELFSLMTKNLGAFTHFFLSEKHNLTPRQIFLAKERRVSGVATSMIADILCFADSHGAEAAQKTKRGLYYLGSLTQFTDDLRDYTVDTARGNANLLAGLEDKYGTEAPAVFAAWYTREEKRMLKSFRDSGVAFDAEILRAIPWYPFLIP
jgi:hypothetical protein